MRKQCHAYISVWSPLLARNLRWFHVSALFDFMQRFDDYSTLFARSLCRELPLACHEDRLPLLENCLAHVPPGQQQSIERSISRIAEATAWYRKPLKINEAYPMARQSCTLTQHPSAHALGYVSALSKFMQHSDDHSRLFAHSLCAARPLECHEDHLQILEGRLVRAPPGQQQSVERSISHIAKQQLRTGGRRKEMKSARQCGSPALVSRRPFVRACDDKLLPIGSHENACRGSRSMLSHLGAG